MLLRSAQSALLPALALALVACGGRDPRPTTVASDGTSVGLCAPSECAMLAGPTPRACHDGTTAGPTGRCIEREGRCVLEQRRCDEPDPRLTDAEAMAALRRIEGSFDDDAARDGLLGSQDAFNRCYAAAVARNPTLSDSVAVSFVIERDGTVREAEVDSPNVSLVSCVSAVLQRLRFSPGPLGGVVHYEATLAFDTTVAPPAGTTPASTSP